MTKLLSQALHMAVEAQLGDFFTEYVLEQLMKVLAYIHIVNCYLLVTQQGEGQFQKSL